MQLGGFEIHPGPSLACITHLLSLFILLSPLRLSRCRYFVPSSSSSSSSSSEVKVLNTKLVIGFLSLISPIVAMPISHHHRYHRYSPLSSIRDRGSTTLYAAYTVDTVYTIDTVGMVYTVDIIYTVDMVCAVDMVCTVVMVYTVDTVYII